LVEIVLSARWILDGGTVGGANTKGGGCWFQYGEVGIQYVQHQQLADVVESMRRGRAFAGPGKGRPDKAKGFQRALVVEEKRPLPLG